MIPPVPPKQKKEIQIGLHPMDAFPSSYGVQDKYFGKALAK
jgi:hypothetical protein